MKQTQKSEWEIQYEIFRKIFARSKKGNLWAKIDCYIVSVFERNGDWVYCISDDDEPLYESGFISEEDALQSAFSELFYT